MTPLERQAHDIICIVKYGSPGGSASKSEIKAVADYLQRQQPRPAPAVVPTLTPPAVKLQLPTIKIPG